MFKQKLFFIVALFLLIIKINFIKPEMISINMNSIKHYNSNMMNNSVEDIDDSNYDSDNYIEDVNDWNFHNVIENQIQLFKVIKFYLCNRYKTEYFHNIILNNTGFNNNLNDTDVDGENDTNRPHLVKNVISNSNVVITEIFEDLKKFNQSDRVTEEFMKILQTELFQPVMLKKIDRFTMDRYTTLASTYLWYDENYKLSVSNKFLKYNLMNNNLSLILNYKTQKHNFNTLIIVKNLLILKSFLRIYIPRFPFNGYTNHRQFIIFIEDKIDMTDTESAELLNRLMQRIWKNYGVLNFIIVINNNNNNYLYGVYIPFVEQILWLTYEDLLETKMLLYDKLRDFNQFKLYFTMFARPPTMLKEANLPRNYVEFNQNFRDVKKLTNGFGGLDAMVLGNMAKALNFVPIISSPKDGIDYGYIFDNGSFTGTMGDVVYRRADISLNGRFIKYYDTNEIEFTHSVYFDKLCVISPKAQKIPQWLAIFLCYHRYVWLLIVFVNSFCGYFWYFLKESSAKFEKRLTTKRKSDDLMHLFIEMWLILLSAPSNKMPTKIHERIFILTCLLANLIISGTFQGSLTSAFSTTSYYKDINTLAQLDKSGLPIGTSSRGLADVFGEGGGPLITSLRNKFHILDEPAILRTAYKRDYCCIERLSDLKLLLHEFYENPDGSPMLHPIKQCPRSYYLAYIVKKGWPFLYRFNRKLKQFYEAGFLRKWYLDAEYSRAIDRNFQNKYKISKLQAFTLKDMQTAFFILSAGMLISTFIFIVECLIKRQAVCTKQEKSSCKKKKLQPPSRNTNNNIPVAMKDKNIIQLSR